MKDRWEEKERLERQIIAALLMDYDGLIDFLDIPFEEFKSDYAEILKAMKESWTSDPTVIATKCRNVSIDEIRDISTEILTCNQSDFLVFVESLQDILTKEKLSSKIHDLGIKLKSWLPITDIYEEITKLKSEWEVKQDLKWALTELYEEITWEREVKIVKTWYTDIDNLIWWFEANQIVVIGARPWVWKSMFAINLINNNILAWEKVALFSLEMDNKQVLRRLLAMNSWVWVWKLKEKVEWEMWEKVWRWFSRLWDQLQNLRIFDNVHTIGEVEREIRKLKHQQWVSIFYLDYLQLIRNPSVKWNPIEALTDMSQRLKQLALQLWVTIVELSQLNRESDKSAVKRASQLRWSWSIEQDADMVRILDKEDETWNKIQVSIQKCRDGRIGDVELMQMSDIMKISDLPTKPKPF